MSVADLSADKGGIAERAVIGRDRIDQIAVVRRGLTGRAEPTAAGLDRRREGRTPADRLDQPLVGQVGGPAGAAEIELADGEVTPNRTQT